MFPKMRNNYLFTDMGLYGIYMIIYMNYSSFLYVADF